MIFTSRYDSQTRIWWSYNSNFTRLDHFIEYVTYSMFWDTPNHMNHETNRISLDQSLDHKRYQHQNRSIETLMTNINKTKINPKKIMRQILITNCGPWSHAI